MEYEIVKKDERTFYTKGLGKSIGVELEVILDSLTAARVGTEIAKKIFDMFIRRTEGVTLAEGLMLNDFELKQTPCFRKEGEISVLTKRKVMLVESRDREEFKTFRLALSDFRGRW